MAGNRKTGSEMIFNGVTWPYKTSVDQKIHQKLCTLRCLEDIHREEPSQSVVETREKYKGTGHWMI